MTENQKPADGAEQHPVDEVWAGEKEAAAGSHSRDAEWQMQLQEANDRALRAQAEMENFRRRMRREMDEERKYAQQPLLMDLLPVLDNIERALQAAEKSPDASGLLDGVKLVAQQLLTALEKHHCQRISAAEQPFDPQLHEALSQQPSADHPPHTVLYVYQQGYQLHDRVIRPAQVIVSSAAS